MAVVQYIFTCKQYVECTFLINKQIIRFPKCLSIPSWLCQERVKSYFLISDVSAYNITLQCRQHAACELWVEQACFKLLSLSIKLPWIHLQDRNKELAKSKVSMQIRIITDRKLSWATNVQNTMGKRQKCSKFKESSEDTFSIAYRSYMTNNGAWQQSNGYSKAKLSAETAQDPEHYTAYHHINHNGCPGVSEWHEASAHLTV